MTTSTDCIILPNGRGLVFAALGVRVFGEQIGQATKDKAAWHTVVIRSTILPGTMRKTVIPVLEAVKVMTYVSTIGT